VVRWSFGGMSSATVTLLLGLGYVLATPTLPWVEQPVVRSIAMIRAIPGIKDLFDADLGWCTYYLPPCRAIRPHVGRERFSFGDRIKAEKPDAIMLSYGLLAIDGVENDPLYRQLKSDPQSLGYEAVLLPQGRTLLLKRQGDALQRAQ
jgi:hypothetical protein